MIKSLQKNLLSYSCVTGFALVGIMFLFQPSTYAVDNIRESSCPITEAKYQTCKTGCDRNASSTIDAGKATTQSSASSGNIRTSYKSLKGQDKVRIDAASSGNYKKCVKKCLVTYTSECKLESN